jgi:hypothetical protein
MFTVEKGIPVPEQAKSPGRRKGGLAEALRNMEVGDSVFIPCKDKDMRYRLKATSASGTNMKREKGFTSTFTTRQVEGGVRIWRVT